MKWNEFSFWQPVVISVLLGSLLTAGCSHAPDHPPSATSAQTELQFVDLQKFDNSLHASLSQTLPRVEVAFYNDVTPNQIPDRLQNWMAAVESGGGNVQVVPPPSSLQAKSPLMLISMISTLWTASKTAREMSSGARFQSAKKYDAQIVLKNNDKGQSIVDKIIFVERKKSIP
jgi:hypothetical protein